MQKLTFRKGKKAGGMRIIEKKFGGSEYSSYLCRDETIEAVDCRERTDAAGRVPAG